MQPRSLNKFQLIHTYDAFYGFLRCPDDDYPYYTMIRKTGDSSDPLFHCTYCQANVTLGSDAWSQILAKVQVHNPNVTLEA